MQFSQSSFIGGMNNQLDPTKVPAMGNSYFLGINVRNREDVLDPIKSPLDLSNSIPSGKFQGLYGAGTYLLLFIDGIPYIRNVLDFNTGFRALNTPAMSATVDYIYTEFVPAATLGYLRVKNTTNNNVQFDIESDEPFLSSQQGAIYQDGINRPRLLVDNSYDVEELQDYAAWTLQSREYVPVVKQMLYYSSILFAIDGNRIVRSVSGQPTNFVVPILEDGSKVSSAEEVGGAPATSKNVDFEDLTSIRAVPSDNILAVTTLNKTFLVSLNLEESLQIFSEPRLDVFPIAAIGAVNQFCFADMGGNTGIISTNGIYSFNSASILKQESNNDPVSGVISRLFKLSDDLYVTQDYPCAFEYGSEYALFAVNTIYGRGVLIYDKILAKFVSLDIYEGISQIKMFASVVVEGRRRLFFITTDNKFYEAFAGATVEEAGVLVGEWCSNDPMVDQNPMMLRLIFTECEQTGTVTVTPIVNRQEFTPKTEVLKQNTTTKTLPMSIPFGGSSNNTAQNVSFNLFGTIASGWKVACMINWDCKAKLTHISLTSETQTAQINNKTKSARNAALANS